MESKYDKISYIIDAYNYETYVQTHKFYFTNSYTIKFLEFIDIGSLHSNFNSHKMKPHMC